MKIKTQIIAGLLIASTAGTAGAANFVTQGDLTWMPVTGEARMWGQANNYCTNTTIKGKTGWRLPTKNELEALYNSGAELDHGWILLYTWSSTPGGQGGRHGGRHGEHYAVGLKNGDGDFINDTENIAYMTCVR